MTKELLHPGLGSAALREALEQRIKECRETAERWKTESRNVRIDRAIHKDYSLALNAFANLLERALSLSSPTEPVCEDCDTAAKCHGLGNCPAQASSEIRGALETRIVNLKANLEHWRDINARLKRGETVNLLSSNESYHGDEISFLEKILDALSRQGAGGK